MDSRYTENREDTDVRARRRKVVEDFDRGIAAIVLMVKGIFRAAGRADLAARFRATVRRAPRRTLSATEPVDETPTETESVEETPTIPDPS